MGIIFEQENQIFHLQTKNTSYIMKVVKNKYLSHVYWGRKILTPDMENAQLNRFIGFSAAADNEDQTYSLDFVCQEYPTGCSTDFRIPAISVLFEDGSRNTQLLYKDFQIIAGKPGLEGLPATYVEKDSDADTLMITLEDSLQKIKVILMYTVFRELDVITRSVQVVNESNARVVFWLLYTSPSPRDSCASRMQSSA